MTTINSTDWVDARGEKWNRHLGAMEAMLAPIDEPLLGALRLDAPVRIADVACGGGDTTRRLARRSPPGSAVSGFDISPTLIDTARRRSTAGDVTFTCADVATSPPPAAPFDRLASRFGVMFFADPPAAFRNLAGWLAPGGRFAFAVWGPLAENPLTLAVRDAVAAHVELPAPVADAPGPFRYADVEPLLALLRGAGFDALEANRWRGRVPVGGGMDPDDAAAFTLAAFSFGDALADQPDAVREAARRGLRDRFAQHVEDGRVAMDACVWIVAGGRAAP